MSHHFREKQPHPRESAFLILHESHRLVAAGHLEKYTSVLSYLTSAEEQAPSSAAMDCLQLEREPAFLAPGEHSSPEPVSHHFGSTLPDDCFQRVPP